jgi:DMSO/TMAO reductase YedYZ molybdopterin-dependent catalytic subunit
MGLIIRQKEPHNLETPFSEVDSFLTPKWELGAVGNAEWTGVPLGALPDRAGMGEGACEIVLEGADRGTPKEQAAPPGPISYARSLPRDKAIQREVLIAYQMNGRDLPLDHGYRCARLSLVIMEWLRSNG